MKYNYTYHNIFLHALSKTYQDTATTIVFKLILRILTGQRYSLVPILSSRGKG